MFDEGEAVVHNSLSDLSKAPEKKSNASDSCLPASIRYILTDTRKIFAESLGANRVYSNALNKVTFLLLEPQAAPLPG